jgi:hypothetical protein
MPKRVAPLSVKKLASIRPGEKPIELVDGYVPGLRVRILPSGTRTWSLNIRDSKGIRRRFEVGSGLSLAEARRKAEDLRRNVRGGADPTTERRAARQRALAAKGGVGTLAALVETYFTNGPGARQRRAVKSRQQLETVFATMLNKPLLDIRRAELQLIPIAGRARHPPHLRSAFCAPVSNGPRNADWSGRGSPVLNNPEELESATAS